MKIYLDAKYLFAPNTWPPAFPILSVWFKPLGLFVFPCFRKPSPTRTQGNVFCFQNNHVIAVTRESVTELKMTYGKIGRKNSNTDCGRRGVTPVRHTVHSSGRDVGINLTTVGVRRGTSGGNEKFWLVFLFFVFPRPSPFAVLSI